MTSREEWIQARLAEAPPLSQHQIAGLRAVLAPAVREVQRKTTPARSPRRTAA